MARWCIKNVALRGVSGTVPDNKIDSHDFSFFTHEEAEIFINTVGIKERYMAPEGVCASDLCYDAAVRLLDSLGWSRDSIDVLIFESVTGDYRTPPTSGILQDRLGLPTSAFVLDMPMGCCGCIYSVTVAGNLLSSGSVRRALLLIGDTITRMGSPYDKSRYPLFGDGAVAMALEYDEHADDILIEFGTLGSSYQALMTPHGGFRHPITPESFKYEDFGNGIIRSPKDTLINGMDVFAFAISKPPVSVKNFMDDYDIDPEKDVDYFLIHQANKLIVDRVVKKLKLNPEKVPYNLQRFGNLGGASIPMLMVTEIADTLRSGRHSLLCSAFGLGLTWGTMWLKTDNLKIITLNHYKCYPY